MNDAEIAAYVRAAAALTEMPLSPEREGAVATVLARLAAFAADVHAFPLGDDIEIPSAVAGADR